MLLLIDNYDSFTYNLFQYLRELGQEVRGIRNDKTTLDEIEAHAARAHRHLAGAVEPRSRRASPTTSSGISARSCPYWVSAWGTSASATATAAGSCRAGKIMHGKIVADTA